MNRYQVRGFVSGWITTGARRGREERSRTTLRGERRVESEFDLVWPGFSVVEVGTILSQHLCGTEFLESFGGSFLCGPQCWVLGPVHSHG